MLTVIKRSGYAEPFEAEKLRICLANTSDDAGVPLTDADLGQIVIEVERILQGRGEVYHHQVASVVTGVLLAQGFTRMAGAYVGFMQAIAD